MGIYDSQHNLTIKGVKLTIGDNVDIIMENLGRRLLVNTTDDYNSLAFGIPRYSETFSINYDPQMNLILEISFIS